MERIPWCANLLVAAQTANLPCLSRAAPRIIPELVRCRQPHRRYPDFGLPIVSRHPRHTGGQLLVRRLSSSLRTIIRDFHFSSDPPRIKHPSLGSSSSLLHCLGLVAWDNRQ